MRIKKVLTFFIALSLFAVVSAFAGDGSSSAQGNSKADETPLSAPDAKPQVAKVEPPLVAIKPQVVAAKSPVVPAEPPLVAITPQVVQVAPQVIAVNPPVVPVQPSVAALQAPVVPVQPQAVAVTVPVVPVVPQIVVANSQPIQVEPKIVIANSSAQGRPQSSLAKPVAPEVKPGPNLFAEHFFAPSGQKLDYKISEVRGFSILKTPSRSQNSDYSIVTDFGGGVVKSRYLPGLKDVKAIDEHIKKNLKTANFQGVEIRQLPITDAKGQITELYWVGDKAFTTPDGATAEIISLKMAVESQGGNFSEAVRAAPVYIPEPEKVIEIKTPAQFKKEEELILKFTDQMGIGEKMFGVFQGVPCGENITWQSFGETSWRLTNLSANHFDTQVGFWTNRIVFKGIRFPLHTIDPFIESTVSMQSDSTDFANNLQLFAGLEWRPLARNAFLYNFRPFGDIPILEWMRNYRFYIKYGDQRNLKDEIQNSSDYDLIWGVQCYYEWGTELPPLDETKAEKFTDYIRQYVWGEYFGNYFVSKTGFSSEKSFNAFIANSTVTMGLKLPGIPLPHNYINDELVLMPYMRFEHVNNAEFSFWYQNQFFVAAGLRIMPFRTYRWKENEWLSKAAVFAEFDGIGGAQRVKQEGEAPLIPNYDFRVGVKFSSRRF